MKKCPFCAEEIQDEALKCKYCGSFLPLPPPPPPDPEAIAQQKAQDQKIRVVGLIAFGIIAAPIMAWWSGTIAKTGRDPLFDRPSASQRSSMPSKAEWRQRISGYWTPPYYMQPITIAKFKSLVGEPNRTQVIGTRAYWYYKCSDGMIQMVITDPAMTDGQLLVNSINDY